MINFRPVLLSVTVVVSATFLAACGSDPSATTTSRQNDMQVVAGDDDAVQADGTITLTSNELRTCKNFVTQAGKVHGNMTAMAETGETGDGMATYIGGMTGWLTNLTGEVRQASTPQFVAALSQILAGGQPALDKLGAGTAPEAADYDPTAIADGLTQAATLCQSAGVSISWHA